MGLNPHAVKVQAPEGKGEERGRSEDGARGRDKSRPYQIPFLPAPPSRFAP